MATPSTKSRPTRPPYNRQDPRRRRPRRNPVQQTHTHHRREGGRRRRLQGLRRRGQSDGDSGGPGRGTRRTPSHGGGDAASRNPAPSRSSGGDGWRWRGGVVSHVPAREGGDVSREEADIRIF